MDIIDAKGASLSQIDVINIYQQIRKLAPPRFLTMRMHPDTWKFIDQLSAPTHVIQHGTIPGQLGKRILKLACVQPPPGISDGVTVIQDVNKPVGEIVIEIHGIPEIVFKGYAITS